MNVLLELHKADVKALKLAMEMIAETEVTQVVFLTDSLLMLQAMASEKENELNNKLTDQLMIKYLVNCFDCDMISFKQEREPNSACKNEF